jgi:hypothetical protein
MQKFNYKCSNCIYIMNYYLCKLYLLIICLSFCTFWKWWWIRWWPYSQWLNMPSCSALLNSSSTSFLLNNFISSSCFYLCSLCYASFSFIILCNFSITFSTHMLLWTLDFWKCSQLPTIDENNFQQLPYLFMSLSFPPVAFIFLLARHLLINTWSSKLIQPIIITLCVRCTTTCKHFMSSLRMNASNFIFLLAHIPNLPTLVV